jgi:cell volume regulation protein A
MKLFLIVLVFVGALLSPLAVRTGTPLQLFFLVIGMPVGEDGPGRMNFDDFELAYRLGSVAAGQPADIIDAGER